MASYAAVAPSPQKLRDQADNTDRTGHQRYVAFRTIRERITEEIGGSVVAETNLSTFSSSKSPYNMIILSWFNYQTNALALFES
jgi:hypothetical protein